jgi:hypothetical protein
MKENSAEIEFKQADWQSVGLRLLVFARYWAKAHYGWYEGKPMPGGNTPEDVVCEVYAAFHCGDRHFNDSDAMWIQLKRAVKSQLWNIHTLKKHKAVAIEDPEFFDPISDGKPTPEAELHTVEFYEKFFHALYADPRVVKSEDLRKLVKAFEDGAREVPDLIKESGLPPARVYEMRRVLKAVAETALNKLNRDGVGYERQISKRSAQTA